MNYLEKNKTWWDDKIDSHLNSELYNLESWKKGASSLKEIELSLLGNVSGKRILHLQCHFGQDSMTLQRMGAEVIGVDISSEAIKKARELNDELDLTCTFIESDILQLKDHDLGLFDLIYASYGVLGWHPDVSAWMDIAQHFTKEGGRILYVEFHPAMWMFDDDFTEIKYSYFNTEPIVETTSESYASEGKTKELEIVSWNHSIGDVYNAMKKSGYCIEDFQEYDFSPYNIYNSTTKKKDRYYVKGLEHKLPLTYSIGGIKQSIKF